MVKNTNKDNILIKRKIQSLLKQRNIKANNKIIQKIDNYTKDFLFKFLDSISYNLKIQGRKIIKEHDLNDSLENLKKQEISFEI